MIKTMTTPIITIPFVEPISVLSTTGVGVVCCKVVTAKSLAAATGALKLVITKTRIRITNKKMHALKMLCVFIVSSL